MPCMCKYKCIQWCSLFLGTSDLCLSKCYRIQNGNLLDIQPHECHACINTKCTQWCSLLLGTSDLRLNGIKTCWTLCHLENFLTKYISPSLWNSAPPMFTGHRQNTARLLVKIKHEILLFQFSVESLLPAETSWARSPLSAYLMVFWYPKLFIKCSL